MIDFLIIGGGAAGFFTAINLAENHPNKKIVILERGKTVLEKVRISGGGRCNVTHAAFIPKELVKNYPRGEKELLGPFHQFCSGDTIAWFEQRGVSLKIEDDGRLFPQTDSSQTIINCFQKEVQKHKIDVKTNQSVKTIKQKDSHWEVTTTDAHFLAKKLIICTGSNPKIWEILNSLGHTIIAPVPSLFTFNCKDKRIENLMGISTSSVVKIQDTKLETQGPLLITHWGFSGPAILRLSAWGARILAEKNYLFTLNINWIPEYSNEECLEQLLQVKQTYPKKSILNTNTFQLPNRLWENLVVAATSMPEIKWADVTRKQLASLAHQLTQSKFQVNGKSTFKEEFVTAGGIDLKEVNFKTMESKLLPQLYFAGEVLNIDAITGGFNFQNAWTTGYIVAKNA